MFIVLVHPIQGRHIVYGPFGAQLSAADYAKAHHEITGLPTEVRPLSAPITYGDEGL